MSDQEFRVQPVAIWSDREQVFGERPGVANGLLYLPGTHVLGEPGRAVLFAHRWGGYHYDPLPRALGPVLADRGVAMLSFGLRRRGLEGPLGAAPDDDVSDLKLALDYLASVGYRDVALAGEEVGALSVARYVRAHPDLRDAGVALIRPARDLHPPDGGLAGLRGLRGNGGRRRARLSPGCGVRPSDRWDLRRRRWAVDPGVPERRPVAGVVGPHGRHQAEPGGGEGAAAAVDSRCRRRVGTHSGGEDRQQARDRGPGNRR